MEAVLHLFLSTVGNYISKQLAVFLVSICPVLELRAGILASVALKVPLIQAILLCLIGNILPMPFFMFLLKRLFAAVRRSPGRHRFAEWIEQKALSKKSERMERTAFWGIVAFVAIPLPGTGGWSGAIIASALRMDVRKATLALFLGMCIAMSIMVLVSYGLIGHFVH
ncbi:uncharacterized membrane protein [Clostridium sp. SY8519]|uniref:COG2426 family protein n=1 Tax=Clostridium sp. (strain SY8519) TaxID=1042156 RepID=UPI0002171A09|nr:small multi-drug export protein [Clostridium sp. SY8519]BAK48059.1 uncharacterized membrane protein [Clostridium sp. SY8519]